MTYTAKLYKVDKKKKSVLFKAMLKTSQLNSSLPADVKIKQDILKTKTDYCIYQ